MRWRPTVLQRVCQIASPLAVLGVSLPPSAMCPLLRYGCPLVGGNPQEMLPPAPPRRSSTNVDGALQKELKCR